MSSEITRKLLQIAAVEGLPGWETRLFLITYPAGADGSGHSHPIPGIGYVLEGTMVSAFDDDPEEIILAGQDFRDKASFHRVVRNGSATKPMRFVIAYTVKVGEPNTTWPQPSLIGGEWEGPRFRKGVALRLMCFSAPILPKKFHINPAKLIGAACLSAATANEPGCYFRYAETLVR